MGETEAAEPQEEGGEDGEGQEEEPLAPGAEPPALEEEDQVG